MTKSVTYAREALYFSEYFGDVTAFIEGPWITQLTDFSQEADQYRRDYWAARNAEKSQKKALAEETVRALTFADGSCVEVWDLPAGGCQHARES
jgi:hypothetical protein